MRELRNPSTERADARVMGQIHGEAMRAFAFSNSISTDASGDYLGYEACSPKTSAKANLSHILEFKLSAMSTVANDVKGKWSHTTVSSLG